MRDTKFYATLQAESAAEAQELSNTLRMFSANTYVVGDTVSVFCIGASSINILKIRSICYRYANLETA